VHHFDLWRYLLDAEVVRVTAHAIASPSDDALVGVTADFDTGALASSVFGFQGPASHDIEIIGQAASVGFSLYRADSFEVRPAGRFSRTLASISGFGAAVGTAYRGGDYADSYRRHWMGFLCMVRSDGPCPAALEDGVEALRIALAAHRSIETSRSCYIR